MSVDNILNNVKQLTMPNSERENPVGVILSAIPEHKHPELAELLVDYAQANGTLLEFIANAVSLEVEQTKHESVLFREDCFAVKSINRVLFSDLGKRYLSKLIVPICSSIVSCGVTLDISAEQYKSSPAQWKANLDTNMKLLKSFFDLFAKSPTFSPVLFRDIFSYIQQTVNAKFGKNNVYVLDFVFFKFICPAIINPLKYSLLGDLVEKMTPNTFRAFVNFSKLLNNVAHGIYDKYEGPEFQQLTDLIKQMHPILLQNLDILVNPIEIQKTKLIIDSNQNASQSGEELQEIEFKLRGFLFPIFLRRSSVSSEDSVESGVEKMETVVTDFLNKLESLPWKSETFKGITYSTAKDKSIPCFLTKSQISAPLLKVYQFLKTPEKMKHIIGDAFIAVEQHFLAPHYSEHCTKLSYPFPFSPRAYYTVQWDCFLSDRKAVVIQDQMPANKREAIGFSKGFVETHMELCGWLLEANENDDVTTITWMLHVSAGGSLPKWFTKSMVAGSFYQLDMTRNYLEN